MRRAWRCAATDPIRSPLTRSSRPCGKPAWICRPSTRRPPREAWPSTCPNAEARQGSAGGLQSLRDAAYGDPQRAEQGLILAPRRTPALEQVHLHEVHGIDIGIAQVDGPLQGRIAVEQTR